MCSFLFVNLVCAQEPDQPNTCVECHLSLEGPLVEAVNNWNQSIHKKAGIACQDCHGGDPSSYDEAMEPAKGFKGKPKKEDIPALCAGCHSDAKRMRVYNLRTDQYAFYQQSIHGKRLAKDKDPKVATCVDCHGNHAVFSRKDPRSPVYRPNIITTCGKCHSDQAYMKEYGIPTNQLEQYRQSYHGKLLLEKEDPRVPTCADCHGGHGATPPGTREVTEVCGNCHSVTAEYFSQSAHFRAVKETGKPRCIDCHGKHFIPFPTSAKFTGTGENDCRSCHPEGSPHYAAGEKLKNLLDGAEASVHQGRMEITQLKNKGGTGFEVSRLGDKLDEANTKFIKTVAMTHALQMPDLEKRGDEVSGIAQRVHEEIEAVYRELKIRYVGLAVTWVFLLLLAWALNEKRKTL